MKNTLSGGRSGKIFKIKNTVVRPANPWTKNVHGFLAYLKNKQIDFVPTPIAFSDSEEIVSFMDGAVYNEPLPEMMLTDEMIISAARLLRQFHEAGSSYLSSLTGQEVWMLDSAAQPEVMCHGDFAPYNVTIMDGVAKNLFDFDTLHPGSRLEDISYAVYRWVPFYSTTEEGALEERQQLERLRLFLDTYDLSMAERERLPEAMINRLEQLVHFMQVQAENGNSDFQKNIDDGHLGKYLNDITYIIGMKDKIRSAIMEEC